MRKKIIGIILLVLIIFGGYKLFANVSANNVNSKSIHFSYDDITEYKGDNPYVYQNANMIASPGVILMYMLMIISRILQVQRLKMNAI